MKYLIQFEFQKDKKSIFWLPIFFEAEKIETANNLAKTIYAFLNETFKKVNNYDIQLYDENAINHKILKDYIEDEREGKYHVLNLTNNVEIKDIDEKTNGKITFKKDIFLNEYNKKLITYLDFKKNSVLTRKISDNINNFEQYLIVKLKRKAAIIMEPKKNPIADLEKLRGVLMLGGLIVSGLIVLSMINFRFYDVKASELGQLVVQEEEEDIIPITQQNTPPPPPPPPPPAAPEVLEIVEDDVEVEEEVEINTEADANTVVEEFAVEEEPEEETVFTIVETMPSFPGGVNAMFKYLGKNLKYPPAAKAENITGKVFVNFTVGKDGKIRDIKILRGVNELLDNEAKRVVAAMPKWSPGKQRGKAVSVSYNLPINFTLQ